MNFFEGHVASVSDNIAAIEIAPGQQLRVPAVNGTMPGENVIVAVRPEKIDAVTVPPQGAENVVAGALWQDPISAIVAFC